MLEYILIIITQTVFILGSSNRIKEINNICYKIDKKFISQQETVKDFFKNNNFNFEKEKNYKKSDELFEFLIGNRDEEEYDITTFQILKRYLLNWYILPIIFLWIIFGIFFYVKKYLFKSELKFKIIPKYYTIIILVIFALILMFSISILGNLKKLQFSINDAFCNLLKFFYELNHGRIKGKNDIDSTKDKWPGLYTLNSILLDTSESINKLSKTINNTFSFMPEIEQDIEKYQNLINLLAIKASEGIDNKTYNKSEGIIPIYLYEFNNISKTNSLIYNINSEFKTYFFNSSQTLTYLYNVSIDLSEKSSIYDLSLDYIFDNISDYCDSIKEKSSNIINNIIFFQKNSERIISFIKIINVLCILISISTLIFVIMHFFKNLLWIKISLNVIWNILFFLIILYILAYYFIYNLNNGTKHNIFLIDNKIITNTNLFFDTCLNTKESDLNVLFDIYNKKSALLEIYDYYKNISPILHSLTTYEIELPEMREIKLALNELNKYLNNYELSTNSSDKINDISYILDDLSKYTNNFKEGKEKGYCDSNDIWVSSQDKCKNHRYVKMDDFENILKRKENEKYCFIIQDAYKEEDIKIIYGGICSNKAYSQIVEHITFLTNFYNHNEYLLRKFEEILKEIENINKKLSETIISQIKKCKDILEDFIDIYQPILGNSSITDLFKCKRLKHDIINFYDISYNFITYYCCAIKIYVILIILLGLLGIVFIIIYNYRNSKDIKIRYMKFHHKDLNNDGVELIEELPDEEDNT